MFRSGTPLFLPMLKIYAVPISLYCAKLRIVLRHKQLDWEEVPPPGGYGSDEYRQRVPAGNLPALEHDGLLIADSEAIAEYLNEEFPVPDMLPGNPGQRAHIRSLSRFHDTRLEPAVRALFPHIAAPDSEPDELNRLWSVLKLRLHQIDGLLPFAPRILTLGDCGLPITATWIDALTHHFKFEPIINTTFQNYLRQLQQHDAVSTELKDYRPRLNKWLASQ